MSGPISEQQPEFRLAGRRNLVQSSVIELIHALLYLYTSLGLVRIPFSVIKQWKLVEAASKLLIIYNCLLTSKFALLSLLFFLINLNIDKHQIDIRSLNCTLSNLKPVIVAQPNETNSNANSNSSNAIQINGNARAIHYEGPAVRINSMMVPYLEAISEQLPDVGKLLDTFGGPFRLLDDRATLIYGVWAIAGYFLLVLYPIELMYSKEVSHNFLRFLMNDPSCMADFYKRLGEQLARMGSWSRHADSKLTKAIKMMQCKRDLRIHYKAIAHLNTKAAHLSPATSFVLAVGSSGQHREATDSHLAAISQALIRSGAVDCKSRGGAKLKAAARLRRLLPSIGHPLKGRVSSLREIWLREPPLNDSDQVYEYAELHMDGRAAVRHTSRLEARLAINHLDGASYTVRLAELKLRHSKPLVRSEAWLRVIRLVCPLLITFHVVFLTASYYLVVLTLERSMWDILKACRQPSQRADSVEPMEEKSWSFWGKLIYYETIYFVIPISVAQNFYCSNFFGTLCELYVWARELLQQLELCARVIELDGLTHAGSLRPIAVRRRLAALNITYGYNQPDDDDDDEDLSSRLEFCSCANEFGGFKELIPSLGYLTGMLARVVTLNLISRPGNEKQRLRKQTCYDRFISPLDRHRHHNQLVIRFLSRRETLLRATYLNMRLFFDEIREARPTMTKILRRTILLAAGYAFMLSITRSQFKLKSGEYWYLSLMIMSILLVFNLLLILAACVNKNINKVLAKVHSLAAAYIESGSQEVDMLEFWLRLVISLDEEADVLAYCIYGHKITWSSVALLNSLIVTLYYLTA